MSLEEGMCCCSAYLLWLYGGAMTGVNALATGASMDSSGLTQGAGMAIVGVGVGTGLL